MNNKLRFIPAILLLIFVTFAMQAHALNVSKWRYRMTVNIETPEGIKSGSAVREVSAAQGIHLFPEMGPAIGVSGEAVVVDLGKYGVVFATLTGAIHGPDYGSDIIFNVLPVTKETRSGLDRIPPKGAIMPLSPDQYPVFARFTDLNDPTTVEDVTKYEKHPDGLHYALKGYLFGDGIHLKNVTLEMTDDPMSEWKLQNWLPWIHEKKIRSKGALPSRHFNTGDFIRGANLKSKGLK
ncbi:MAG: hypothetical protein ACAH80_05880 [Alphaproteobacteria bacterium]